MIVWHVIFSNELTGFTVGDGPLRDLESPENKAFVEELMRGFVPSEVPDAKTAVHQS